MQDEMKDILRYMAYSVVIVVLAIGCINIFKSHPEVQFAFIMPGIFIVLYSVIRDDIYKKTNIHLVRAGFRGK